MRNIALLAALAAVAACSPAETEETVAADAAAVDKTEAVAETTAADGGPSHGTFRITQADGDVIIEELAEDGTFTATDQDGEVTTGTYEQRSPNEFCSKDDDEAEMKCYAEEVNAEGVWTSTDPDDGETSTVERVTDEETA
ncbi:hypothetical protein [Erythrobacter rubeus]|uniref:Lipoprotein n=1 Tax=Erythrobacter rubeus TaxID=2760803 RepID=A0ABR8KP73_9SPHN|nr:hypothetical protein [Erythrobacter rubeus]MBD2842481.1 hypothetical protein [Erythrobacter rubeus]